MTGRRLDGSTAGTLKYNPARDVAHLFPAVVQTAYENAAVGKPVKQIDQWCQSLGITDEQIKDGFEAYVAFMRLAHSEPTFKLGRALDVSLWTSIRWEVQAVVMFYIGMALTGVFFHGTRDAATGEEGDYMTQMRELVESSREYSRHIAMPRWKRWLYRLRNRI